MTHKIEVEEIKVGKQLYDYQHHAIEQIFNRIEEHKSDFNLLYQLPTGGGKTVIFSELARKYIKDTGKKVLILTHRIELCAQTSKMLFEANVKNKIINSKVKELPDANDYSCFVAMVETLNNRLNDEKLNFDDVGLIIIDEAHYNSFRKLFKFFEGRFLLGVTATPLSSNIDLPMKGIYKELIVGDTIPSLIGKGFLAKATTYSYDVRLGSLKVGVNGDYTVSSSERLYSTFLMQEKLLQSYEEKAKNKKVLIFNNGIQTSVHVYETFKAAGYNIRHLDNTNSRTERVDILRWFKETPDAILTSVGILTTGFDEPTVDIIILNRATKSITLYFQMIGRGSRSLPNKKNFSVIDLGNNAARFGLWDDPLDWHEIFKNPDFYIQNIASDTDIEKKFRYEMPDEIRDQFSKSETVKFDVEEEYTQVMNAFLKPRTVIDRSIEQHAQICAENSEDVYDARDLAKLLNDDIEFRVKK